MASIRGKQVRWIDPATGKRRAQTFATERDAMIFGARCEQEAELYATGLIDADQLRQARVRVVPISEVVEMFSDELDKRQVTEDHRYNVRSNLDRALRGVGAQTVRDLTPQRIAGYLGRVVRDGKSAVAHNHLRGALGAFCSWLVVFGYLDRSPVDAVKPLKASRDRRHISRALSLEEVGRLTERLNRSPGAPGHGLTAATAAPGRQLTPATRSIRLRRRVLYLFRAMTGLRVREASRVRWSDIDLKTKTVTLRTDVTKNARADSLPLADDLCDAFAQLQADALRAGHGLGLRPFPAVPNLRTWYRDLERVGVKAKTDAGAADPKCLRKTFDSFLLRADVDLLDVMLLMRHTPPGGMALTLGTYGDEAALLTRKRRALARMVVWIDTQHAASAAASG